MSKRIRIQFSVTVYGTAKNGNKAKSKGMSRSVPCPLCLGPKSYKAELCRQCHQDYLELGVCIFQSNFSR